MTAYLLTSAPITRESSANPSGCWQAKRAREAEGVKERQDAQDSIVGVQHEYLVELLDVRRNIIVREDDAFRVAGRAAGKNNRGNVIERRGAIAAREFLDGFRRQEGRSQRRRKAFAKSRILGHILNENRLPGRLDFDLFEKNARGDHRF